MLLADFLSLFSVFCIWVLGFWVLLVVESKKIGLGVGAFLLLLGVLV